MTRTASAGIWVVAAACALLIGGCSESRHPLRIGAKNFDEQRVLAHMLAELAHDAGKRARVVDCGDTYGCQQALRQGQVDAMVEYSGTLDVLGGYGERAIPAATLDSVQPGSSDAGAARDGGRVDGGSVQASRKVLDDAAARAVVAPEEMPESESAEGEQIDAGAVSADESEADGYRALGLHWVGHLGFDNSYRLVVPTARAAAMGLESIGDLARLSGGVRVAVPTEYARRPRDGLLALFRRYGLELAAPPLLLNNPGERYEAVFEGRVDAAVAYNTDAALEGRRLRVLADPLDFFPQYDAAVVARDDAVEHHAEIARIRERLAGRLTTSIMRQLNGRVQVEGHPPASVATEFLKAEGLVEGDRRGAREAELLVVTHEDDRLRGETGRALRAAARAFPRRTIHAREVEDPFEQLADGVARLAIAGSERFFHLQRGELRRDPRAEAISVIGTRLIHLVRRAGDTPEGPLAGRVGTLPAGSGAATICEALLRSAGKAIAMRGQPGALLEALSGGAIDAALIVAEAPEPELAESFASRDGLKLVALSEGLGDRGLRQLPYLRRARITPRTYVGQEEPVDTFGSQVLIAAPAAQPGGASRVGGPAAALRTTGLPLTSDEVNALVGATALAELPDPVLPSPWSLRRGEAGAQSDRADTVDTVLNVAAWALIAWLVMLLVAPKNPPWRPSPGATK